MPEFDDHPRLLPPNYRINHRFFLWPVRVAGVYRQLEWVPIVQRFHLTPATEVRADRYLWVDVGYLDEVLPSLKPAPFAEVDHA
jgi:hypothetical protein